MLKRDLYEPKSDDHSEPPVISYPPHTEWGVIKTCGECVHFTLARVFLLTDPIDQQEIRTCPIQNVPVHPLNRACGKLEPTLKARE